jgi:hypothetical protein
MMIYDRPPPVEPVDPAPPSAEEAAGILARQRRSD